MHGDPIPPPQDARDPGGPSAGFSRAPARSGRRPLALIVDDQPDLGTLMARALGARGWETVVATAGEHAAELARSHRLDLLVTDLQMPGMSGMDLATSLRADRADLPVVLVSGSPDAAALDLPPPFAFLAKPFSLASLFGVIGTLVPEELREA